MYNSSSSFGIADNAILTLKAGGNPDAFWVFQAGSTLDTGSNSVVLLIGGAQASNVFWQVGSSATLGTDTQFAGSIMAQESITLTTGASIIEGRALAITSAVTMDNNTIVIPEPGSVLLLGAGLMVGLFRRRVT